jgi:hypothetical protein
LLEKNISPTIPAYVIKNEIKKFFSKRCLKIRNVRNATKIGAELIIIVALDTEVIPMLQCHKIKSIVNPADAIAV